MEIKQIVKEMLSAGMPESEILANLTDLGIPDAPKVLAEAKAAASPKAAAPAAPKPAPVQRPVMESEEMGAPKSSSRSSLFDEPSEPASSRPSLFDDKPGEAEPALSGSLLGSSSLGSDQKLDELIALSKSLLELNRKILESNREILLKLSK